MDKVRIENDVKIEWTILNKDGSLFSFDNIQGLKVSIYPTGCVSLCYNPEISIEGSSLTFVFPADKQTRLGPYDIRLEYREPDPRLETGYSKVVMDKLECFALVPHSNQETLLLGDDDVVNLTSIRGRRLTGGGSVWGGIRGNITDQADLMGLVVVLENEEAYNALGDKKMYVLYCW